MISSHMFATFLKVLNLPLLSGYIIFGLIFGPDLLGFIEKSTISALWMMDGTALALIAIKIGSELKIGVMKKYKKILFFLFLSHISIFLVTGVLIFMFCSNLGIFKINFHTFSISLFLSIFALTSAPAFVVAFSDEIKRETENTNISVAITTMDDLFAIVATTLIFSLREGGAAHLFFLKITYSCILGLFLGFLISLYVRKIKKEAILLLLFVAFLCGEASSYFYLEGLLLSIFLGFYFQNFSPSYTWLDEMVKKASLPMYIIYFTIMGASVNLFSLVSVIPKAFLFCIFRAFLLFLATRIAIRDSALKELKNWLWTAAVPQAGISLAIIFLAEKFITDALKTFLIAVVAINQIFGPLILKMGMTKIEGLSDPKMN